jgi:beta-galactosidase
VNLGTQYYRPPFPRQKHWEEDFKRIADSGLDTVQLWVVWGWVESKPGIFEYGDYDRLVELAGANKLKVVLSTIAEIQPHWIHREAPGSEMLTAMGSPVVSSCRSECHFGLTPGGCTDHPRVWELMRRFLATTAQRYCGADHLVGWDAWNELRWNVQADGLVCYCPHTLKAFRQWLSDTYDGLQGLNEAWLRRYGDWSEVMPGKTAGRTYTEMMAFAQFLTERCNRHAQARYEVIKAIDPGRPVTVHAAEPCPGMQGGREMTPIDRGNDWALADRADGIGCSSFPKWAGLDDADFGMRVEFVRSAAQGKRVWLSEVQGGRSSLGFDIHAPVDAASQQRWIWNGVACGAEMILFWCWRDEVFGRESGGFGITGRDGLAAERLAALRKTGQLLRRHAGLLASYRPDQPAVGVFFSPRSYYLYWSQEATAKRPAGALGAYARALTRRSIPYTVVEENHLSALDPIKILFLPRVAVTDAATEKRLEAFVRGGGTLVCESESGAFDPHGLYREPPERFLTALTGVEEVGRRAVVDDFEAVCEGRKLRLGSVQWLTPMAGGGDTVATHPEGALITEVQIGQGRVILVGGYLGGWYQNTRSDDFETFLELAVRKAGWQPDVAVVAPRPSERSFVYVKSGTSAGQRLVWVFLPQGVETATLRFKPGIFASDALTDILTGRTFRLIRATDGDELTLDAREWGFAALVGASATP